METTTNTTANIQYYYLVATEEGNPLKVFLQLGHAQKRGRRMATKLNENLVLYRQPMTSTGSMERMGKLYPYK